MAFQAPVVRDRGEPAGTANARTGADFTPVAGRWLFHFVGVRDNAAAASATLTLTHTFGGTWTWTTKLLQSSFNAFYCFYAFVPDDVTGPGHITITAQAGFTGQRWRWLTIDNGPTHALNSITNFVVVSIGNASPTANLPNVPLATSMILHGAYNASGTTAMVAVDTQIDSVGGTASLVGTAIAQWRTGSTSKACSLTNAQTLNYHVAFEIVANPPLLTVDVANYVYTARDAALLLGRKLAAAPANYIFTAKAVTLTPASAVIVNPPTELFTPVVSTGASRTRTTPSNTPPGGDLVVIHCSARQQTGGNLPDFVLTQTHANAASWQWTKHQVDDGNPSIGRFVLAVFYAFAPVGTGAGTFTLDSGVTTLPPNWWKITGLTYHNVFLPWNIKMDGSQVVSTPSIVLDTPPLVTSAVLGAIVSLVVSPGSITPDPSANFVEIYDLGDGSASRGMELARNAATPPSDTMAWTGAGTINVIILMEIQLHTAAQTLTAAKASYSYTARSANLVRTTNLPVAGAAYQWTPQQATLEYGRKVAAALAAYLWGARPVGLMFGRNLIASPANYSWTAKPVGSLRTYKFPADVTAYIFTARSVLLSKGQRVLVDLAAYHWTAKPAGVLVGRNLIAANSNYVWTAKPANLLRGSKVTADLAAYIYSAKSVSLYKNRLVAAAVAAYQWTAKPAGLLVGRVVVVAKADYAWTARDVAFLRSIVIPATVAAYQWRARDASLILTGKTALVADMAAYHWNPQSVQFLRTVIMPVAKASFTWTARAVGLLFGRNAIVSPANYSWTGRPVNLLRGLHALVDPASYAYTAKDITLLVGKLIPAAVAHYQWLAKPVGFLLGHNLLVAPSSIIWNARDVNFKRGTVTPHSVTNYIYTANPAGLLIGRPPLVAASASYLWTPKSVTFPRIYIATLDPVVYHWETPTTRLLPHIRFHVDIANYHWTARDADLIQGYLISAGTAEYRWHARDVVLGAPIPIPGGVRIDHVINVELRPRVIRGKIGL